MQPSVQKIITNWWDFLHCYHPGTCPHLVDSVGLLLRTVVWCRCHRNLRIKIKEQFITCSQFPLKWSHWCLPKRQWTEIRDNLNMHYASIHEGYCIDHQCKRPKITSHSVVNDKVKSSYCPDWQWCKSLLIDAKQNGLQDKAKGRHIKN